MNLRNGLLLVVVLGLMGLGIAYAVEIQRGVGGSVIVGRVETAEETILLWKSLDPKVPLTELDFGTGDVNAFGLFKSLPGVPMYVENAGDVGFELRAEAKDVRIDGNPVGDVVALRFEPIPVPQPTPTPTVAPTPTLSSSSAATANASGSADSGTSVRGEPVQGPEATVAPAITPTITPTPTPRPPLPLLTTIRPGQIVGFKVRLRFLNRPQDLGVKTGSSITFTALFKAEGPVVLPPPTPTPTPTPVPVTFEFPLIPPWVGNGKHYAGKLDFAYTSNLTRTWDPHQIRSWGRSMGGPSKQFNQLVEYNPVGNTSEIIGDLARKWTISNGGRTYTFTLHEALWWNGERVTAADVVFSMDRMTDPNATRGGTQPLTQFYAPGNSRVIDDQTVEITLKAPASGFIPRLASDYMKIYSKAVVEPQSDEDILCCPENNVGSGPWRIVDVKPGESIRYERNPLYFKTGRPFWDETEVFVLKDRNRLLTAYRTQQVVGLWSPHVGGRPPIDVLQVEAETNGKMRAKFAPAQALNQITLRTTQPPFDDPNLRKAFHLAIDRDKLITLMQSGFALPGTFLVPNIVEDIATLDQVPGWRRPKEQDLQEARALLAAAGYTDANPLKGVLNGGNTASSVRMLEAVAATLRDSVPIDLTPKPQDINANYDDAAKGTYLASAWTTGILIPDPSEMIGSAIDVKTQRNPHDWTTPRMTELIALQAAELDPDKRKVHLTEMVEIFRTGESHFVPLVWAFSEGILDHRMRNYHMSPTYHLIHKFDHVWWDPDHDPTHYADYEILERPRTP